MRFRRRTAKLLAFAALAFLLVQIPGGIFLADSTLHPQRLPLTPADTEQARAFAQTFGATLDEVSITAADGATLRAWRLHPAHPNRVSGRGNAALLLHGLGDNRKGMSGYAELLLRHGYTVLMPDARAHGTSGGSLATFGVIERNDIHAWVAWLRARENPACVFGLGESMGAAQLLQDTFAADFCAVVAESPFASFREIAYDRMGQNLFGDRIKAGPWVGRTLLRPLVEVAFLRSRWKWNIDMERAAPDDAVRHSATPVLLIHGADDGNIPVRHSRMIAAARRDVVLWEPDGTDHAEAISKHPREFEQRVLGWYEGR